MISKRVPIQDPLEFIRQCVVEKRMYWTYHVTMRMERRSISRQMILESVESYDLVESYPDDKYLPSYLVWARHGEEIFHILFATDVANHNVRIVTAYRPNPEEWERGYKRRQVR